MSREETSNYSKGSMGFGASFLQHRLQLSKTSNAQLNQLALECNEKNLNDLFYPISWKISIYFQRTMKYPENIDWFIGRQ